MDLPGMLLQVHDINGKSKFLPTKNSPRNLKSKISGYWTFLKFIVLNILVVMCWRVGMFVQFSNKFEFNLTRWLIDWPLKSLIPIHPSGSFGSVFFSTLHLLLQKSWKIDNEGFIHEDFNDLGILKNKTESTIFKILKLNVSKSKEFCLHWRS